MNDQERTSDFLGCGWKFPPGVDKVTGRMKTSSLEEDIKEAIRIILFTRKGERVMQPEFGCGIQNYAFSDMSMMDLRSMEQDILEAIIRWEPRVIKTEVEIGKEHIEKGFLEISVTYTVRSTNNPYNMVFPYYINEGS